MLIFHVTADGDWAAVPDGGAYDVSTRGATLADVGFLHASLHHQVDGVLERFYADADDLALLVVDTDRLSAPWRLDPVGDEHFPHVYGPLRRDEVVEVVPLARAADGSVDVPWMLPTELPAGAATVRAAREDDRRLIAAYLADPVLRKHLGGPLSLEEARSAARSADLTGWLVLEDAGTPVGLLVLERRGDGLALSFVVDAAHQGRGLATLAARAVLGWSFALDPDLAEVVVLTHEANLAAAAVVRRLGGAPVGGDRTSDRPVVVWSVTRPDTDG